MKRLLAVILLLFSGKVIAQKLVAVDPELKYQTIEGWGGSLSWWANNVGGWATTAQVDTICNWITGVNELNMNIFRFNIAGGENPAHSHMRSDAVIPGYKPTEAGAYDWTRDANQRKFLLALKPKRADNIFEAVSYSPPYWMTNSNCTNGGTGGVENIKTAYYDDYADYLTEVVKNYKTLYNIQFRTLAPLNEPEQAWAALTTNGQEGCYVNWDHQIQLLTECKNKITAKGLSVQLSANDANSINYCVDALNYFGATNIAKIAQINTHSYGGTQRSQLYQIANQYSKRLWQSESGPLFITSPDGSELGYDMVIASRIVQDVHDMRTNAWVDWQLMDRTTNIWGLLRYDDVAHTFVKTKNYYVRMQFSRFIKQGYSIIETNQANTLAALNPANNQLVLVIVNPTLGDSSYKVDLNLFAGASTATVYRTSTTEDCATLTSMALSNGQLSYTAPAKSVTTFVIPVTLAGSPVANGLYSIQAKHSSKYMSVAGWSSVNGAQIEQWSWLNQSNLKFNVLKTNYGYSITPSYNTKVFSIDASISTNGALCKQWDDLGAASQRFNIIDVGSGYYKIVAHNSAKCLAITGAGLNNGDDVVQWEWLNGDNFKWKFTTVSAGLMAMDASSSTIKNDVGMADLSVIIYPNPASNILHINLPASAGKNNQVTITDISGKKVYLRQRAGAGITDINLRNKFTSGIYIVTVNTNGKTVSDKIVIQ
jgi:O-glycosyl hydrolase